MSLYKGNNLISGHQVLYSTTGQNTDGAMTQKAATDTFANVDLSNLDATATANIDGQWVYSASTLASGVAAPTTDAITYSLSSYLPNDGYKYEVLFTATATTGSTSGNVVRVSLLTDIILDDVFVCGGRTRTSSTTYCNGCISLPVGAGRYVNVGTYSGNTGTFTLYARGYRRIGTNS